MNLQFSQAQLAQMSPEVRAWAIRNGYLGGGQPVTNTPMNMPSSNLGMGGNKPSYLHFDPTPHQGQSIPMSEYGNRPGGAPIPFNQSTAGQGTPIPFNDPSIAGQSIPFNQADTVNTMNTLGSNPNYGQFYNRMNTQNRIAQTGFDQLPTGSSGYTSVDLASQQASNKAVSNSVANSSTTTLPGADPSVADTASGGDVMTGAKYYGANVATDALINTHNRKKVNTPLGNKGSQGGIVKGGIKGALMGAQLSGGNPYVTAGSAIVGAYTGAQGGFDTADAPQYQILRARRRSGGGGLLAPKGVYG